MSLREALRTHTRSQHDKLDSMLSQFDLTTRTDLGHFLSAHWCAWDSLLRGKPGPRAHAALTQRVDALRHDLGVLDCNPPAAAPLSVPEMSCLYIATGAQLGTEIMRRVWQNASDPKVRKAGRFISQPVIPGAWRSICAELDEIEADSAKGDDIVVGAKNVFNHFIECTERELHGNDHFRLNRLRS